MCVPTVPIIYIELIYIVIIGIIGTSARICARKGFLNLGNTTSAQFFH